MAAAPSVGMWCWGCCVARAAGRKVMDNVVPRDMDSRVWT